MEARDVGFAEQEKLVVFSGFCKDEAKLIAGAGRPVATAQLPDGSLLLSDDVTNAIYRITYEEPSAPAPAPATLPVSTTG